MTPKILVVDLETTSTNPQRAHILEVGLALVDLATRLIEPLIDTLVCPECDEAEWIDCWFMQHSGLAPEQIRAAPKWEQTRLRAAELCQAWPVTAFNRSYDIQILSRHQVQTPMRAPCLMLTCKDILCLPGHYGDWKYPRFSEAWHWFFPDQPFEDKHRAGHDALREAKLAAAMYGRGFLKLKIDSYGGE